MAVNFVKDAVQLEQIMQNETVVLLVWVAWSPYPVMTRPKFERIAKRIAADYRQSQVRFYIIEEDTEFAAAWLEASHIEGLPGKYTMGWGTILWFQDGQVVHKLLHSHDLPEEDLYEATIRAFGLSAPEAGAV